MKQRTTMQQREQENHIVKMGLLDAKLPENTTERKSRILQQVLLGKTKFELTTRSFERDLTRVKLAIEEIESLENKQWLQFAEPIGQLLQLQRLLTDVLATLEDTEE